MEVEAADAVLVRPAVAVVVDSLRGDDIIALAGRGPYHQPARRIGGIDHHRALARLDLLADLEDEAVAVEVLGRILVEQAVAVVVVRPDRAAVRLGRVQVQLRAVGVVLDPDVDRLRVDELGERRVLAVAAKDVPGEPEGGLGRRHLARMPVAFDEHGRLVGVLAGGLVRDRDLPDIAPFERLPDGVEIDEVRIIGGPLAQEGRDFLVGVVVREVHHSRGLRLGEVIADPREVADSMSDTADRVGGRQLRRLKLPASEPGFLGRQSDDQDGRERHGRCELTCVLVHGTSSRLRKSENMRNASPSQPPRAIAPNTLSATLAGLLRGDDATAWGAGRERTEGERPSDTQRSDSELRIWEIS